MPKLKNPDNALCKQCQLGKMTKSSFKSKTYASNDILELVHTDLCGCIGVQRYVGDKYVILFVGEYSRMMIVMFLKEKYDVFQFIKWYLAIFENEIGKSIKCLRSDRGGEFISNEFNILSNDKVVKRHMSTPRCWR